MVMDQQEKIRYKKLEQLQTELWHHQLLKKKRKLPDHFPNIVGPNADGPLEKELARMSMEKIMQKVNRHNILKGIRTYSLEEVADGFVRVANEAML